MLPSAATSIGPTQADDWPEPHKVHQLLAALSYGDAVSNDALALQAYLREAGFESDVFAEQAHPRMTRKCRPLFEYEAVSGPETVCLYHFSIGSAASRFIFHAPDRLVIRYHNITPGRFFAPFMPHLARQVEEGRAQLQGFAARTELGLGVSEFNRRELEAAGFSRTAVFPIFPRLHPAGRPAAPRAARALPRRPHQPAVRGPRHLQQEDRGPAARLRGVPAPSRPEEPAPRGGRHPGLRGLLPSPRAAGARAAPLGRGLHGAGGGRGAPRALPGGGRVRQPVRARGLLRPPAGGDGVRGAGPRLRRGCRGGDAARRRRPAEGQAPGGGGGGDPRGGEGRRPCARPSSPPRSARCASPGTRTRAGASCGLSRPSWADHVSAPGSALPAPRLRGAAPGRHRSRRRRTCSSRSAPAAAP